jgi:DNA-binding Xre family transcriptional regulator
MRGHPRQAAPEHRPISTTPKARPEPKLPEPVSASRHAKPFGAHSAPKPKVLMGEVVGPRGQQIGRQRDAFRAFMIARGLRPSEWAKAAGIAPGEIMAFLTGHARGISPASLEKLARAASCAVEDFFP